MLDPGFGFAKETDENVELMARFAELHAFRLPLLAGTSRKRFLGAITGREAPDRDVATAATTALAATWRALRFSAYMMSQSTGMRLMVADAMLASEADRQISHGHGRLT